MVFQRYRLVVGRGDAGAIVLDFYGINSLIFESYICWGERFVSCALHTTQGDAIPRVVVPASTLFSTSSLTTEQRSTMT